VNPSLPPSPSSLPSDEAWELLQLQLGRLSKGEMVALARGLRSWSVSSANRETKDFVENLLPEE
jgi:hypothetical protein